MTEEKILSYKGFGPDWKCRDTNTWYSLNASGELVEA